MRITLAQLDPVLGDIDANVEAATRAVTTAASEGSDLVVFPELFLSGYSVDDVDVDLSIAATDPRLEKVGRAAQGAGVLLGFMESGRGPHDYNSAAYYEGPRLVHVHRKLYLPTYRPFHERGTFSPGQGLRSFPVGADATAAVLICNDAWQAPIAFIATQDGAQVLLVPAASAQSRFPDRYDSHEYWHSITRFYGRMFQLYVVFVNRVGTEGWMRFWGGSHVIDPWGNLVAEAGDDEQLLTVDLDLADVRHRRRQVPLVREARLGLIQREVARLVDEGGDL